MNTNRLILSSVFPVSESKIVTVGLSPVKNFKTYIKISRKDESVGGGGLTFSLEEFINIWKFLVNIETSKHPYGTYKVNGTDYSISVTSMMSEKRVILLHKTSDFLQQHFVLDEKMVQYLLFIERSIFDYIDHCKMCENQVVDYYNYLIKKICNLYQKSSDNNIKTKIIKDFLDFSHPEASVENTFIFDYNLFVAEMHIFFIDLILLDYLKTVYTLR